MLVNFAFAFDHQPQGHRLHPTRRQTSASTFDFAPQHRRQFVTHQPVEYAPCLLGIHQVEVDSAGNLNGVQDGVLGDLPENDPFCVGFQAKCFFEVPRNSFAFAVIIRCQPYFIGFFSQLFKLADQLLFVGRYLVIRGEAVLHINGKAIFRQVANVAEARPDHEVAAEVAFNCFRFRGRFDND